MRAARIAQGVMTAAVAMFLALPALVVIPASFNDNRYLDFPPKETSVRWYREFFGRDDWIESVKRSLIVGAGATIMATVAGVGAAVLIARRTSRVRGLLQTVALVPLVVPVIVLAAGTFRLAALTDRVGSPWALAVAHAALGLPFVVLVVTAALQGVDERQEMAARTMGVGAIRAFRDVTYPQIRPAVLAGAGFAFLTSFDEVVIALFLSGAASPTLPVRFFTFLRSEITPLIAAVSSLLIVSVLGAVAIMAAARRWGTRTDRSTA